jgi:ketosteroid isomerase-like protein
MSLSAARADAVEVATAFADAYARGDAAAAARWLAPDVREREIAPTRIVDQRGRDAVVAELTEFLRPYGPPEILRHTVEPLGPLVRWSTRWLMRADGRSLEVEWHAFLTIQGGLVTRLDVVCSGLVPQDDERGI